ncbi:MAG: PTS sugar transporter subunit IIC [Erysipelotrichaceae bacterium]|nr:PTS sugar transporter subunit IIC [Erysipelotrichaceae bacterium]
MSENKFEGLQAWLQKAAGKLSANIYINVIKEAMLAYMPFTIIASIPLIISNFPYQPFSDFITGIVGSTVWIDLCMSVYFATINIAALLVCITTSYTLAKKLKINELQAVLTALVSFLIVTPLGEGKSITNVSASSMFTCMIVSMVAVKLYKAICDKDIKIKMPESVPPAVAAPFESLVPTASVVFLFLLVSCIMTAFGTDLNSFINGTIGLPIMLVGGSIFGVVFAKVFEQALWFFGIHGGSIVSGVMTPVLQVLETQNLEAVTAGGAPINIISNSFFSHFCSIGLVGAVIAALICARSKQYKEISRIAIGPYVFGVGEPALFGFPLMLNFKLIIPFVFSNTVSALIAYAAFALKLVPIPTGLIQLPWTTPVILSGMLVTQSWKGAVLQLVQLVVATAFWLPFMRSADKDVLASEQGE